MLSQGAFLKSETFECDGYLVSSIIDHDYGVSEITLCFPYDESPNMIYRVSPDIHNIYKEYILNYQLKVPVSLDISGDD